ncbi:helix-turn-helix domain-containing protein [Streptomyces scopuliridis]|uniref:helix-turn-helix domain-containing protein n=1 Tax=Streptomyces scopuliridis TaxID=452529 RepID=UPI002DD81EB6|nr:helix-turn-helix domain-containing protein [Streptomyces scopuliridis]WSB38182.1 helix-turn-helix domain-containing protein [Streptomyces scopuliridis]
MEGDPERRAPDGRLDEFLYVVGQLAWRPDAGLQGVVDWLHRQLGTEIALIDGAGAVELSTPRFPEEVLGPLGPMLTRLATGRIASAVTEIGAVHLRLEAVGAESPRRVLVLAGPAGLGRRAASLASHTGSVISILHRARAADTALHGYQEKAHQLRVALFMALMAGDTVLARRMTTGAVPALLDCDRIRVHLLRCPPEDRDRLARAYQDSSGYHGRGLMVRCPVYDEHLICLIAEDDGPHDRDTQGPGGPVGLGAALRELVGDSPRYALGISGTHPLRATAEAYEQARHALAVAGNAPGRVAGYRGQEPLERLLPRDAAVGWARSFLRPLRSLPTLTLETTRLAMHFPRSGVAGLLGISRNTVTAHLTRAENALGVDLREVRSRATVALALAITGLYQDAETVAGDPAVPVAEALFHTRAAAAWAEGFLAPLDGTGHRRVRTTLRTWIETNTDAQRTARLLGNSRTTVAAHLRTAERLLNRDLLTTGSGVHDLVYAFGLLGEIPLAPDRAP